jgi:hypothetical protein
MTLDELKTLLALNGQQRLPHLETEIFADITLYTCYLESLCSKYEWYRHYDTKDPLDIGWLVLSYAELVIQGRWPEAEHIIITTTVPHYAYLYAIDIINDRWPEAENLIATDLEKAFDYHCDINDGEWRWPLLEEKILAGNHFKLAEIYNSCVGDIFKLTI